MSGFLALGAIAACAPAGEGAISSAAASGASAEITGEAVTGPPEPRLDPALARAIDEGFAAMEAGAPAPVGSGGATARCLPLPAGPAGGAAAKAWRAALREGVQPQVEGDVAFVTIGQIRPANTSLCLGKIGGAWKLTGYLPGA